MNYLCARLFRHAEHRENALHGMLSLFVDRFGPDVISTELHASVPALVRRLAPGRKPHAGAGIDAPLA
jgi:hypothetical protein